MLDNKWVLINRDNNAYVADMRKSKTGSSFTKDIRCAQLFDSREQAISNSCVENEHPARLSDLF